MFDPSTNDTDADGDPLWVKAVQPETANGRLFWEEGGSLRYTPNPDFNGSDSFTYTTSDGLATATATVYVTVDSVNDAPAAFNDAYRSSSGMIVVGDGDNSTLQLRFGVLANDIDYDGAVAGVGVVDPQGGNFTISQDQQAVIWTVPNGYSGSATFRYKAVDNQEAQSDWATVKVWADPIQPPQNPPPPPVVANPDTYAIGDDLQTGNVRANDSGGDITILSFHPTGSRVTTFAFDGTFQVAPTLARQSTSFAYTLFSADGKQSAVGAVNLSKVDLTIYHGQNGKAVSELNEKVAAAGAAGGNPLIPAFKATGAFTAANLNDSNANGTADCFEADTPGEKDVMKLVMTKPTPVAGAGPVTLTITAAGLPVKVWKSPTKGGRPTRSTT